MNETNNNIVIPIVDGTVNDSKSTEQPTPADVPAEGALGGMLAQYMNELLMQTEALRARVEQTVKEREDALRLQLQSAYGEIKRLAADNHALAAEVGDLRSANSDLEKKVSDYQQQAEKRNFNAELRKQNNEMSAELEDMKATMNKKVRERVKESTDKIYEKVNTLLKKQLDEVMASDGSHEWNKQRKLLLGIFWRVPEIGGPLDAAGDEMIENSRLALRQAKQREEEEQARVAREEERADRTVDAMERQAEKPAAQIRMDAATINANGETVIKDSTVERYYENINLKEKKG